MLNENFFFSNETHEKKAELDKSSTMKKYILKTQRVRNRFLCLPDLIEMIHVERLEGTINLHANEMINT